jgi:hypothetical protein
MSLTIEQAAVVKGLLGRGEKQHDVAGYFGVNGGRVAEIAKGKRFPDVKPASKVDLPTPAQMVPWGFIMAEAQKALAIAEMGIGSARARLNEIQSKLQAATEIERTSRRRKRQ